MRKVVTLTILALAAAPAMAAWVGDVPDLVDPNTSLPVPANTIVNANTGTTYADLATAYGAATNGDSLLCGPGTYAVTYPSLSGGVDIIGSGSDSDPVSNTVFDGGGTASRFFRISTKLGDPGDPMELKDFRIQNLTSGCVSLANMALGAANMVVDNLAMVDFASSAWGDGFEVNTGDVSDVTIQNCLIDGGTVGLPFGIRVANHPSQPGGTKNMRIEGNTITGGKFGIVLNTFLVQDIAILGNDISENTDPAGSDKWNYYNGAGIVIQPRLSGTALVQDVIIEGNRFADNAVVGGDGTEVNVRDAGIYIGTFTGVTMNDIYIKNNKFENNVGVGGAQLTGIDIFHTDYPDRTMDAADPNTGIPYNTGTGTPGVINNLSIGANTYTNMVTDVKGTVGGTLTSPANDPAVFCVDMAGVNASGVVKVGGNGDDVINAADIDGNTEDVDGDGDVDADDRTALLVGALKTKEGDFNLDGKADGNDFLTWQNNYTVPNSPGTYDTGDADSSGMVDGNDFLAWQNAYPTLTNFFYPAGVVAVPEPATMALLGLGGLALIRRRR